MIKIEKFFYKVGEKKAFDLYKKVSLDLKQNIKINKINIVSIYEILIDNIDVNANLLSPAFWSFAFRSSL